jgi:hypothetical protein
MEPIISPWLFYFASVVMNIKILLGVLGTLLIIIGFVRVVSENDSDHSNYTYYHRSIQDVYSNTEEYCNKLKEYLSKDLEDSGLECDKDNKTLSDLRLTMHRLEEIDNRHKELYEDLKKSFITLISAKHNIYLGVVLVILNIMIPSDITIYKMLIASYITPDNIQAGVELTKESIEYILNQIVETAKALSTK